MSTDTNLLEVSRQLRQDINLLATGVDERKKAIIEDINSLREVALSSCPITGLDVIYNTENFVRFDNENGSELAS